MNDNNVKLEFIVNGQPVPVVAHIGWEFREAAVKALEESGNTGQPIENWELRDAAGTVIDMGLKISQSGVEEGAKFFLSLKAGVGGYLVD